MSRIAIDAETAEAVAELLTDSPEVSSLGVLVKLCAAPDFSIVRDMSDDEIVCPVYPSEYSTEPVSRDGDRHEVSVGVTLMKRAPNTFAAAKPVMVVAGAVRDAIKRKNLTIGEALVAEWQATTSDKPFEHQALRETQGLLLIHIIARYSVHTTDHEEE